jgi:hypothetical protein
MRKEGGREGGIRCGFVSDVAIGSFLFSFCSRLFGEVSRYFRFRQVNENL